MEEHHDRKKELWATAVGVVGAWVGLGLLVWQNILTRRSANAALLNAQAAINSERAYITVRYNLIAGGFYNFSGINEGRTPAEITAISSDFVFPETEAEIPQLIKYKTDAFADPIVLSSSREVDICEWAIGQGRCAARR